MTAEDKAKEFLKNLNIADRVLIGKRTKTIDGEIQQKRYTLIELLAKYELELVI